MVQRVSLALSLVMRSRRVVSTGILLGTAIDTVSHRPSFDIPCEKPLQHGQAKSGTVTARVMNTYVNSGVVCFHPCFVALVGKKSRLLNLRSSQPVTENETCAESDGQPRAAQVETKPGQHPTIS